MILGVGTDIVRIARIKRLLEKYPEFAKKVFTAGEIAYCGSRAHPEQSYAVRFAAKEALMKALGTGWSGKVSWLDIEIVKEGEGRPEIAVHNAMTTILASLGADTVHVSLAHEKEYATAFVVLERQKA